MGRGKTWSKDEMKELQNYMDQYSYLNYLSIAKIILCESKIIYGRTASAVADKIRKVADAKTEDEQVVIDFDYEALKAKYEELEADYDYVSATYDYLFSAVYDYATDYFGSPHYDYQVITDCLWNIAPEKMEQKFKRRRKAK